MTYLLTSLLWSLLCFLVGVGVGYLIWGRP